MDFWEIKFEDGRRMKLIDYRGQWRDVFISGVEPSGTATVR
jgi:hypothetical protein